MRVFYEKTESLNELKNLERPSGSDLQKVKQIFEGDEELTRYFYDKLSPSWLELLEGAGQFPQIGEQEVGVVEKYKADYVFRCAEEKPGAVLEIMSKIGAKDAWIQGKFVEALAKMPEQVAAEGVSTVLGYLGGRDYKVWYFIGEPAAKLMVKLVDKQPQEALEIAKALLDVWWPGEGARSILDNIRARFATNEYKRLMFDFYRKVWEKRPFEATSILIEVFDSYLDEYNKVKDYDTSEHLGISIEDLQNIERLDYNLEAIVVKVICDAGKAAVTMETEKTGELLDDLEKRQKAIFYRVVMYLLRFVEAGAETERTNRMVGNAKFTENRMYRYEHRRLLNEKFEEVSEEVKKAFVEWVGKEKVEEKTRKEITEWCSKNKEKIPDFEQMENREKAEELYLVRERFKELYEEYKAKASVKEDQALAPRRMVGEARAVSPMEGTPLQPEVMAKRTVNEVLDFILEPKNYEGKKKSGEWREPVDALRSTFKEDVKKRPIEYLKEGREKLAKLPAEFLSGFFYGISDKVRDGSFKKDGWGDLIGLAYAVVEEKQNEKVYRDCFSGILNALRNEFTQKDKTIEFDKKTIANLWGILETLVRYEEDYKASSDERDPVQMRCTSVNGEALEQVVMLGIVCKRSLEEYYEENLKSEIGKLLDYVVKEVRRPEVNCTFGLDLARIYYLDKKWLGKNIEKVFEGDMWDVVWGTYASWGRPSPSVFNLLVERGKYARAIELIGKPNKFKFGKDPEEGLVEHLMIGFFNDWIGLDGDLLKNFFGKASAELRGKAARFLTTGFKSVTEQGGKEKEKVATRMKEYWGKRIEAIKDEPEGNKDEAIELTGWVEDSVLPAKETLELLEQSLDLSGGKIGKMRDARDFVDGVCELGIGNELLALRCLKKAAADENMHMTWADIQEPLVKFLETIVESPENVKNEAREVADLYGRYNPDKFRDVWEKLWKRQAT